MPQTKLLTPATLTRDLTAGLVVFLVALPLCLGVALASNAPLISGVLAGIIGGLVVGIISGSHSSVSGPAAGLTAIVAAQIAVLGSFEAFLLAVVIAGVMQVALGIARAGFIAAFFPSSVIKGLLAAIGIILILKQIPHLFGYDKDPEGEMSFIQPDKENTFSALGAMLPEIHPGATAIGMLSIALLVVWDRIKILKKSPLPAPLLVVLLGVGLNALFQQLGGRWFIETSHLVQVPVAETYAGFISFLTLPDFSQLANPLIYKAAITIALVASLETLLNLEAVDRIDPKQRTSPPSRELVAQGFGNITAGMIGGIPITSVIVRSSVNINAGAHSKISAIFHGFLLLFCVVVLPTSLNMIPLSCLAAILLVTGYKLASPKLMKQMFKNGRYQFIPFIVTILAIVFTDLLIGILIGLGVSMSFILYSNFISPLRRVMEKHTGGDVLHIELPNQMGFFKKAALETVLDEVPRGGHVLIDAQQAAYIDPDVLDLIRDYTEKKAPARGVEVSLVGFRKKYHMDDRIQYVDYSSRELQEKASPQQVLDLLKAGHKRFLTGERIVRDLSRQVDATARGQHPLAVVLSCIDSRAPAELIFDLGVGDIFSARVAGNIASNKMLASVEYACAVAGAKLILVMGHTRCGAVTTAVKLLDKGPAAQLTGCQHIDYILNDIQAALNPADFKNLDKLSPAEQDSLLNRASVANVLRTIERVLEESDTIREMVEQKKVAIVGALYDVVTGDIQFLHGGETIESIA